MIFWQMCLSKSEVPFRDFLLSVSDMQHKKLNETYTSRTWEISHSVVFNCSIWRELSEKPKRNLCI